MIRTPRTLAVLFMLTLASVSTAACVGILGIEERPLRDQRSSAEDANITTTDANASSDGGEDGGGGSEDANHGPPGPCGLNLFDGFDTVDDTISPAWSDFFNLGGTIERDETRQHDGPRSERFTAPTSNDHAYLERRITGACAVNIDLWFNTDPASAVNQLVIVEVLLNPSYVLATLYRTPEGGDQIVLQHSNAPRVIGPLTLGKWTHLNLSVVKGAGPNDVHVSSKVDDLPMVENDFESGTPIIPAAVKVGIVSSFPPNLPDSSMVNIDSVSIIH